MLFILGFISGLLASVLILLALIYFKRPIEQKLKLWSDRVEQAGPRPKGFIVEPDDESTEAREEIIKKNRKEGKDTPLSDLR